MGSLRSIAAVVGNSKYHKAAQKTFNSFFLPTGAGGFVMPVGPDGRWIQEYPTQTPSYVLNGHLFAALAVLSYNDPRARRLFLQSARAAVAVLPLFDIPTPAGPRSAYDLIRRRPAPPLRVSGSAIVHSVEVLGKGGRLIARVAAPPNTIIRPSYPVSVLAVPRVWVRIRYKGAGSVSVQDGASWVRLASLPRSDGGSAVFEVPQRFQGRADAGRYHDIHVDLLRRVARASGDARFADWATRWDS